MANKNLPPFKCCECANSTQILQHDVSTPWEHGKPFHPKQNFYPRGADKIFKAKTILTMDPRQPITQAIAVRDGHIVALGEEALKEWQAPQTEIIDYGDHVMIPGFIESHSHPLMYGNCLRFVDVGYTKAKTKKEILQLIEKAAKKSTRQWLFAWNYDFSLLEDKTPITRHDLDLISKDKNIAVIHNSLHLAYVNSKALETVGITKETPDPVGGHLIRDAQGELTGEVQELPAIRLLQAKIPKLNHEESLEAAWLGARAYQKEGITSITDAGVGLRAGWDDISLYEALIESPHFPLRIMGFPTHSVLGYLPLPRNFGDYRFRLGATKFVADGSVQGGTAWFSVDYYDKPGYRGVCTVDEEAFKKDILELHRGGQQVAVHANGDAAIDLVLDALEEALTAYPREDHRHRIEHCQVPREEQIERMARLNILPNFFVNHVYYWGEIHRKQSLGPARSENISPTGWAKKYGLPFTFHSDAPVTEPKPLHTLWIAVNRLTSEGRLLGAEHRITPEEALKALTLDAAYFNFEEHIKGSIEVGKLADFTILSANPLTVPPMEIKEIQILGTVLGGNPTQSAEK